MEHDPLRNRNNALLSLVESGELCFDRVIRVRHVRSLWSFLRAFGESASQRFDGRSN